VVAIRDRLESVRHKILILSGKGGVGKSTFAAQLAYALSSRNYRVGLLDVDICGPSVPLLFGQEGKDVHRSNSGWSPVFVTDNLSLMSIGFLLPNADDAVIWRGPRKDGLIKQFLKDTEWTDLDFLIVDAPPGTSDEHLSVVQHMKLAGIDGAIIITTPQEMALADVRKEINFCKKVGINILGVVENMSGLNLPMNCAQVMFTSAENGSDITLKVRDAIQKNFPSGFTASSANVHFEPSSIRIQIDVFPASRGGALKMCERAGVEYLGSIPLDPAIAVASEKGLSLFSKAEVSDKDLSDAPIQDFASLTSLNSIIDALLLQLNEGKNR